MDCAYCERPLVCESCGANYVPPDPEAYRAIATPGVEVRCPACGEVLVCHWCGTPYVGEDEDEGRPA